MKPTHIHRALAFCLTVITLSTISHAASPASIEQGRQLFEKTWSHGNRAIQSDGLGPLFNAASCVACHNQGGVGGGGEARFNALTLGIEELEVTGGLTTQQVLKTVLLEFHPGFIDNNGVMVNTYAISHHGGSPNLTEANRSFLEKVYAQFSTEGGPVDPTEVRLCNQTPIQYSGQVNRFVLRVQARIFQRNTPALFGAGLIDQVSDRQLDALVAAQQNHPEISGRPSTLRDGRYGKFGWRANMATLIEFTDQACANELGLDTLRKKQPADPTLTSYRNTGIDITDQQIRAMQQFTAALPAPQVKMPEDSLARTKVERGRAVFGSIGCAICHTPDLAPARGIYSDLLLHDMGKESFDLNQAEPFITGREPELRTDIIAPTSNQPRGGYFGASATISTNVAPVNQFSIPPGRPGRSPGANGSPVIQVGQVFRFKAPNQPLERIIRIPVASVDHFVTTATARPGSASSRRPSARRVKARTTKLVRCTIEPTNINQEWRTPPLWGVADSAPYLHDGRAETLLEAIAMHEGEAAGTRDRYLNLPLSDRRALIKFLETLVAPENAPQPAI